MAETEGRNDVEALLAEIHREFRQGLPDRLERIRASLELLAVVYDREAADLFYRTAHSLKGTAPSFHADALVEPAAALSLLGRGWLEVGDVAAEEVTLARREIERLGAAMATFIEEAEKRT